MTESTGPHPIPAISEAARTDRYLFIAILILSVLFSASGLAAMWYVAPRVPYADCWQLTSHFLDCGRLRDVLMAYNGHFGIFPNLVRLAEFRVFSGGQLLHIIVGIALAVATVTQMWRMIGTDHPTAGPASLLFAVIGIFWLGNVRALGHGDFSVPVYIVTFCLVTGIRSLSLPESSPTAALRHAVIAAAAGSVAALSFGSGIACFAAFSFVLTMRRAHWPQWLVVNGAMLTAFAARPFLGNAGLSVAFAPITQATHVVRWLAGPFVYAFWPLLDPAISEQIPLAAVRIPAGFVAHVTEGLFGPVMLARWPHLLIGLLGLAWLALTTWRTWRRPSPTALLGSAMAWFALTVGALIALARLEYLQLYPDQLLAPRYVVWSTLFWTGLGISTVVLARNPVRARVFAVLVGCALLPSQVWMGKLGASVRHVAEQTALAATVGVIEPDLRLGESALDEVSAALPKMRDGHVDMFAWPETRRLGERLPPEDVEFILASKLQVIQVGNRIGGPGRRVCFDLSKATVQRLLLVDGDGVVRGLAMQDGQETHWTGWMRGTGGDTNPRVAAMRSVAYRASTSAGPVEAAEPGVRAPKR